MKTLADVQKAFESLWEQNSYADPSNILMDSPVSALRVTVTISASEPDPQVVPIGTIWMCMTQGKYFRRFLQLMSISTPFVSGVVGVISDQSFAHSWVLVTTVDGMFSNPTEYDLDLGTALKGPKGDQGDPG